MCKIDHVTLIYCKIVECTMYMKYTMYTLYYLNYKGISVTNMAHLVYSNVHSNTCIVAGR